MDKNTSKLKVYLAMLKGGGDSDDEWEVTAAFTTRDNAQAYVCLLYTSPSPRD